jgi:hypothetical protein
MGRMQFIVPDRQRLSAGAIELAYIANHDESPCQTRANWQGDLLVVDRAEAESGTLTIPWQASGRAPLALATGTLVERPRPYLLPLELARGTLSRLRTYVFVWGELGLELPDAIHPLIKQASHEMARAATMQSQPGQAAIHADRALEAALNAGEVLCASYSEQAWRVRKSNMPNVQILVGATLDERAVDQAFADHLLRACNTLAVPLTWSSIEAVQGAPVWDRWDQQVAWCQAHEVRICGGPLLKLDADALPRWVHGQTDFDTLLSYVGAHLQAVVGRYRGRIQLWNCAANLPIGGTLALTEEQRVRLAVRAIETVRAADSQTPIILTLDQPWGEYLRDQRRHLSPIHFADALARAELGLSGIGLSVNVGFAREATLPRDVLEFSRQIDRWSSLGLPLLIQFALPSESAPIHDSQESWIERFVPVLLGKPAVQAVFWGQCFDSADGPFSDRGLFDREGTPKPALAAFSAIRKRVE